MGDTFKQTHSGSGHNIINLGKQTFQLTDAVLAEIVSATRGIENLEVEPHGVTASFPVAEEIVRHLNSNGIAARLGGGTMMMLPPPSASLELRGNQLLVDVSR